MNHQLINYRRTEKRQHASGEIGQPEGATFPEDEAPDAPRNGLRFGLRVLEGPDAPDGRWLRGRCVRTQRQPL